MLYDSEGSRLFECITTLPEYYPTRTERDILANHAEAIIRATGSDYCQPLRLLELGAGTAAKTGILLEAATRSRNEVIYIPVDVSPDALDDACESIGNFSPQEVRTILRNLRSELRAGDALLLGTDMVRDEATLVRVYDDEAGVTAAFNLNILHRLNRYKFTQKTLGALLDDAGFTIEQRWSDPRGWYALTLAGLQY